MLINLNIHPPTRTWQAALCPLKNKKTGKYFIGKMSNDKLRKDLAILREALEPFKPLQPISEPLTVTILLKYPYRKSEKKAITKAKLTIPKDTKPDIDNCVKGIIDMMTKLGFWDDDSLIFDLRIKKVWSDEMGIQISYYGVSDTPF